jgi:hypothetical protein
MASSSRTAADRPDWVLRTPSDARRALAQPGVILAGTTLLSFASGSIAFPRSELKAARLRFWQSVCGCQVAAVVFLAWLLFAAWSAWPMAGFDGWDVAGGFGRALLAAMAAKFVAIVSARAALAIELLWLGSLQ